MRLGFTGRALLMVLASVVLMQGCSTRVGKLYFDFRAYFNTYYNAQDFYELGLEKNIPEPTIPAPGNLIRVFDPPGSGGKGEFDLTIQKAAKILREHDRSSYVLPSILLIGKANFYRGEYFAAIQKFQELRTLDGTGRYGQEAVFWQSRTLYEMGNHLEAIDFTEQALLEGEWIPSIESKTALILAEHHTIAGDITTAVDLLTLTIEQFDDDRLRPRAQFLFAQMLEQEGDYAFAAEVYRDVANSKTIFDLQYLARKKQAVALRKLGERKASLDILTEMFDDDKYRDQFPEIRLEIGLSLVDSTDGESIQESIEWHQQTLRMDPRRLRNGSLPPEFRAQSYSAIADLYRSQKNYGMAATYYDSASQVPINRNRVPPNYKPQETAQIYGEFLSLTTQLSHADSLMSLAAMDSASRQEKISQLRELRAVDWRAEQKQKREAGESLVIIDADGESQDEATESQYGFLSHLNPERVTDKQVQFQALWRGRPLSDGWRSEAIAQALNATPDPIMSELGEGDAITGMVSGQNGEAEDPLDDIDLETYMPPDNQLGINLQEIPLDSASRAQMTTSMATWNYELATLYYLSLDEPQRAKDRYEAVVRDARDPELKSRALYVLTELYASEGTPEQATEYAEQAIQLDAVDEVVRRLIREYGDGLSVATPVDSQMVRDSLAWVQQQRVEQALRGLIDSAKQVDSVGFATQTFVDSVWVDVRGAIQRYVDEYSGSASTDQTGAGDQTGTDQSNRWESVLEYLSVADSLIQKHYGTFNLPNQEMEEPSVPDSAVFDEAQMDSALTNSPASSDSSARANTPAPVDSAASPTSPAPVDSLE
jgi:tetratricopeptide (TPR) repeat protein